MNIAFFEISDSEKKELMQKLKGHNLTFSKSPLSNDNAELARDAEIISVFIYSNIDESVLEQMPKLRLIVTRSTGYDHIDVKECKKRKVLVCNAPDYGKNTVAEHTFGLILALSKSIYRASLRVLGNDFSIKGLEGFDLKGKTLGVIGVGNIGQDVIKIARGFGMNVIASNPRRDKSLERKLNFKYASLTSLLKKSDIVTLHVPLTPKTKHLINQKNIKLIKPSAVLINTSRGDVVETKALLSALEKNKIAGAGLDVIEGEKAIKAEIAAPKKIRGKSNSIAESYEVIRNEKVVFTPHIAFYTQEALKRIMETTIKSVKCFVQNKTKEIPFVN